MKKFTLIVSDSLENANKKAEELLIGKAASWFGVISINCEIKIVGEIKENTVLVVNSFSLNALGDVKNMLDWFVESNKIVVNEPGKQSFECEMKEIIFLISHKFRHLMSDDIYKRCIIVYY